MMTIQPSHDRRTTPDSGRLTPRLTLFWIGFFVALSAGWAEAQIYDLPDRGQPGDAMIQEYLRAAAARLDGSFVQDFKSGDAWKQAQARYREEYLYMLGLWPVPEKTPLQATVTGRLEREEYAVELIHYQSRPGLYVTGNLFRPAPIKSGEKWPAVLYVCGHSGRGRNGNKTAFQSHGIWLARHGYVCLVIDTLQLGEIGAIHHGTYRENRWWWHSRGYTPAGVECWNGVRGIDYLISRPDVDRERIAVTGISGGGAATFWIAAADERVRAAVPVSGMADLLSYVPNRVVNGHCDCMFLYNTFEWPWTRIAGLVAPRPLFFVNSDQDAIFPMDANERVGPRLERLYSLFGAGDRVDSLVSIGGHDYRRDIRQAAYRFIGTHLKNDPTPVTDSEVDLVIEGRTNSRHPIDPEKLRVFPKDSDLPKDQLNTTIDRHFVPMAKVAPPSSQGFESWRKGLVSELRRVTFRHFPERIPAAQVLERLPAGAVRLATEPGIEVRLSSLAPEIAPNRPKRVVLWVDFPDGTNAAAPRVPFVTEPGDALFRLEPRGFGETRWTTKNPPNYVLRAHVLVGRTVDAGRVWDVVAAARYLRETVRGQTPIHLVAVGDSAVLAAYAALLESDIAGVELRHPILSHMDSSAPSLLNVLRACDIPDVLGMLAPRPLGIIANPNAATEKVLAIYRAAGAEAQLRVRNDVP